MRTVSVMFCYITAIFLVSLASTEIGAQLLLVSARAKAGIMAAIIITFLIFIILYFTLFLIEKISEGKFCFYLLE